MPKVRDEPDRCNVCQEMLAPWLSRVPDAEGVERFEIRRCRSCGLGHTSPRPADIRPYYRATYHGKRHGPTERLAIARRLGWVKRVSQSQSRPGVALDVGCGDGTFLAALRDEGWRVAGTELNPARALERGISVYETLDDVARAPEKKRFDLVTLWHSLEHVPDPAGLVRSLKSVLQPNGVLVVAVPNAEGLQAKAFGRHWLHFDVPRHLYHFGPASLDALLAQGGFEGFHRWDEELEYDVMGWAQSALAATTSEPRRFFDLLRGRSWERGPLGSAFHLTAGISLLPAAFVATKIASGLGQGGTLVVAARAKGATSNWE